MNHLKLSSKYDCIPYPVGSHMERTISIVKEMVESIKQLFDKSKNINLFVRGSSGAILAGIVTTLMPEYTIKINHIKKEGENSHSGNSMFHLKGDILVILDDFISSGVTVNEIYKVIISRYGKNTPIDLLCVSGGVPIRDLQFKPINIISGMISC